MVERAPTIRRGPITYTARPSHLDTFSLNIAEDGTVTVVSIVGDIDLRHSARVREALLGCVERAQTVVVDMAAVESIDSSGVAGLLEAGQTAKKAGRRFVLAAVGETVLRVIKIARLDTIFDIVPTVADARTN